MPERCVCCGAIIPEGRQVCPICENGNVGAEQAYRNGYAKGYADAKKNEKHGRWLKTKEQLGWNEVDAVECSECHESWLGDEDDTFDYLEHWFYCPNCGAIMDLPNITENTRKALEKMGENVHSEIDFDYAAEDE